jgi:predicted transcriptional regulator
MAGKKVIHLDLFSLDALGERFVETWERVASGEAVEPYHAVGFETLETLLRTLTPRRWELLAYLRQHGQMTVYGLAQGLRRDYKNVHGDVKALEELDLIGRTKDGKVEVVWDEIEAHIRLAA